MSKPRRSISYAVANRKPDVSLLMLPYLSHDFSSLRQIPFGIDLGDVGVAMSKCHLSRF